MDLKKLQTMPPWEWPPDAGETLLAVLRDASATNEERMLAAELSGDPVVVSDDIVRALMKILRASQEPELLRVTSAVALGPILEQADTDGFDEPDGVPISERSFQDIQAALHTIHGDADASKLLRRRALEASVRAPADWHPGAIRTALGSGDEDWRLTAVFCMRFVRGFEHQILEALEDADPLITAEAVRAAGAWGLDRAWPRVSALLTHESTPRDLLLAAIDAAAWIRPDQAVELLDPLTNSRDPEIAEAAYDAMLLAEAGALDDDEDDTLLN